MILPIVQFGDPILRKRCKEVTEVTEEIETLVENMLETMHDAQGVGRLYNTCTPRDPTCTTNRPHSFLEGEQAGLSTRYPHSLL